MTINYEKDGQGIVTLTIDMLNRSANVLNQRFYEEYAVALQKLEADETLTGVIITSGKKMFVTGADIDESFNSDDAAHYFKLSQQLKAQFRRLETLGKPVVAALNGTALGGGLELALACHYRVGLSRETVNGRILFGFPEVGLGLLPGAGGVVRTVRLIGLQNGLEWLASNKKYSPQQALDAGMIDELAADAAQMMTQARAWILANPAPKAPWDASKRIRIPGGNPNQPHIAQMLAVAPAMIRQETKGNYPAPLAILAAAVEGAQVDFVTACRIESRYFAKLAAGQVSKNMITAFWTQLNQIKKGENRPQEIPPQPTQKVGVLGAGMMGHGIAYVSALAGMDVVLLDADQAKADAGKAKIEAILSKQVGRGRMDAAKMDAVLAKIRATAVYAQLAGCDLIIEAVFEDRELKAKVTKMAEAAMDSGGVFASNTSTLPITGLAQESGRSEKFIGLHFFSPVHKMKLVEIIVGEKTDDATVAKAFDYVLAIKKVPIVVNDSRGFYTSRVFATWTNEGMAMLAEGQHPQAIEMAGIQAGMPLGLLALMDELSLSLADHVRKQAIADNAAAGMLDLDHPAFAVLDKMLALGRKGRAAGAGFYEYEDGNKWLWPQLAEIFMDGQPQLSQQEMMDRILFIQAIETVRCLQEGVLRSVADGNLGSIFGWGFAPIHGGTLQFINAYGVVKFVQRAQELAAKYGSRFASPQLLLTMAENGDIFL
ncbi:Enoyl-CoA hydratase [isoleucine degradation] / 3-hydroxyacyl-CoA dehydrogenase / 3-hydroxybutyryl-CoA epimerase [hydrothermal vent metagenome]|uniref:enoyl-CoA hydratase n=1 Tax=hydrothermal vent metagenome TaxID=652676 RepID=A0A3B0VGQ4_9ZZZZ